MHAAGVPTIGTPAGTQHMVLWYSMPHSQRCVMQVTSRRMSTCASACALVHLLLTVGLSAWDHASRSIALASAATAGAAGAIVTTSAGAAGACT